MLYQTSRRRDLSDSLGQVRGIEAMTTSDMYIVVTTGHILEGFDPADVRNHLVRALRLQPDQAERFFERSRVVKKGLTRGNADKICSQLAKLGVAAEIRSPAAPVTSPPAEPTPAPQEAPGAVPSQLEIVDYESSAAPRQGTVECPNCQHVQPKAEQCESCGVWFHKFDPSAAPVVAPVSASEAVPGVDAAVQAADSTVETVSYSSASEEGALSPAAIAAAAVAALLGAWVWKFVAVSFAIEFGLIAWGIGGAVGFAAASAGSRGVQAGVLCAILAFGAIVLGKYWAYSAFVDQVQDAMAEVMAVAGDEELYGYFEEGVEEAQVFVSGSGSDDFVRRFMVERGYTDATDPSRVSAAELADFREYTEPALREMAAGSQDFEEWQAESVAAFGQISPWAMMREDFGVLDIVFALLGIGTAFRLGGQAD